MPIAIIAKVEVLTEFPLRYKTAERCTVGVRGSAAAGGLQVAERRESVMRLTVLTSLAMIAFAGNSLLCRTALRNTRIDAASFTTIRLISGAAMLWLVARLGRSAHTGKGNWLSAIALFAYAAGFSFAYTILPAGTGALLLFGAVHKTA